MTLHYMSGGTRFNAVGRGPNAVTVSGTAHASFPIANMHSYRPRQPFSWNAGATDLRAIVDVDLCPDGGFEGTLATEWQDSDSGDGASTQDSGVKSAGTYSLKLVPGASGVAARFLVNSVQVRPGERFTVRAQIRQDGTGEVGVRIYIQEMNQALNPSGAFVTLSGDALSGVKTSADTSAAFELKTQTFTIPTRAELGGAREVGLLLWPYSSDSTVTAGYVDELELIPEINTLAVVGNNWPGSVAPVWRSDDDSAFGSAVTRATLTIAKPNIYSLLETGIYARYWDVKLTGFPNVDVPRMGELVMGYSETLAAAPAWGFERTYRREQLRFNTPEGDVHTDGLSDFRRRSARWVFPSQAEAEVTEALDELIEACQHGENPVVVIDDQDGDCIFGRVPPSYTVTHAHVEQWRHELSLIEEPHMVWIDG